MKKISQLFMTLGCLCILVSCCLFGYARYHQYKGTKNMQTLYKETIPLIPDNYISSQGSYLDIQGYDIEAVLEVGPIHWGIGDEEFLPHYKNRNIVIPDLYLEELEKIKSHDILMIRSISGAKKIYSCEVIGEVDTLSQDTLAMYCKSGSSYYCINLIKV
ncbi:hypothetical protein [Catenibacterium faecis]|uniref:hypothetical protein n=1 Tax=Catenibacterium faecis TaxID=2764323 RepID=UPI003F82074D